MLNNVSIVELLSRVDYTHVRSMVAPERLNKKITYRESHP